MIDRILNFFKNKYFLIALALLVVFIAIYQFLDYQNKLKNDKRNSYYWLEPDFEININEQILKTNEILRNNKIFQVIDLHPLFIDKNSIMNEKYSTDGVHLNKLGYQKWIDIINPVLSNIK